MAHLDSKSLKSKPLLDEEESAKLARWENFRQLKYRSFGVQTEQTNSFEYDFRRIKSYRFDIIFRKLVPDNNFKFILNDSQCWEESGGSPSWRKMLFRGYEPDTEKPMVFYHKNKAFDAYEFIIGILSYVKPENYATKLLLGRVLQVLDAEIKLFAKLGIFAIMYDLSKIPSCPDQMEHILATLLHTIRGHRQKEENKSILILKFNIINDDQSKACLLWFQRFRDSMMEFTHLQPAIRLHNELPSDESINAWLQEKPAFLFLGRDLFKINDNNAPYLQPTLRRVATRFMEAKSRLVIQDFDEGISETSIANMSWLRDYLDHMWRTFLPTGRR